MSHRHEFTIEATHAGRRLDRTVTELAEGLSRAHVQRLIEEGEITVNGAVVKAGQKVKAGEIVVVTVPPPRATDLRPEAIPLTVVYEDATVLVIDKPAGLVVHPAPGHANGTVVNAVLAHAPEVAMNGTLRPGIVHRLDKETSGLLVVAKTDAARAALVEQFAERRVHKEYLALVQGYPPAELRIDLPLGRDPLNRQRMAVAPNGRAAVTEVATIESLAGYSLVCARPRTGRTHQIRVHLAFRGHPIVGDTTYGGARRIERRPTGHSARRRLDLERHFLHATRIGFMVPETGLWREFESPLPAELNAVLAWLRDPGAHTS